jgi:hypothetical protein
MTRPALSLGLGNARRIIAAGEYTGILTKSGDAVIGAVGASGVSLQQDIEVAKAAAAGGRDDERRRRHRKCRTPPVVYESSNRYLSVIDRAVLWVKQS